MSFRCTRAGVERRVRGRATGTGSLTPRSARLWSGLCRASRPVWCPSELLTFSELARVMQAGVPILSENNGFFRVEPPHFSATQGYRWDAAYDPRSAQPGINSGYVVPRYDGKAVITCLDGHATLKGWTELQDMRLWADQATRSDWGLGT